MKDWKYTFDPVSREDWIKQIETDLKGRSAESLYPEWWPGETLNPFAHPDDVPEEIVHLPDSFFLKPPDIVEYVKTGSLPPGEVNKKILKALRYGAQTLLLHPDASSEYFKKGWFTEVIPDILRIHFQLDSMSVQDKHAEIQTIPDSIQIRLARNKTSDSLESIFKASVFSDANTRSRFRFAYYFRSGGNWIETASEMLNILLADLISWEKLGFPLHTFFERCILILQADSNYFKHLIQSRTLHFLWQNIKQDFTIEPALMNNHYLETHIEQVPHEKPDHFLIRASMSGLAASLSGTHALCIHHAQDEAMPEYYERINRNIHHLLNYESGMYKGTDPLAGSYAIDFYTRKWTEEIWRKLV